MAGLEMKTWSASVLVARTSNFSPILTTTTSPFSVARYSLPAAPADGGSLEAIRLGQALLLVVGRSHGGVQAAQQAVVGDEVNLVVVEHRRRCVGVATGVGPNGGPGKIPLPIQPDRHQLRIPEPAHDIHDAVLRDRSGNHVGA